MPNTLAVIIAATCIIVTFCAAMSMLTLFRIEDGVSRSLKVLRELRRNQYGT